MQNNTFEDVLAELHETARMLDDIRDSVDFLTVPKTKVQYAFEEREEPLILFRENAVSEVIEMILEYEEQGCSYDDDDDDGPCCNNCQRKLLCPCKDLVIDHVNVADDQQEEMQGCVIKTFNDLKDMAIVDLFFTNDFNDKKKLIVVGLTETFAVPIPQIEVLTTQERTPLIIKNVTANDGVASQDVVIPVMKSKDLKRVSLLSIVDKDRAHQHYMELSSAYSDLAITKIVHDNNIKFTVPELTYVFFDIETYSTERDFNGVPSHEYSHCHISTVQLLIIKGSVERRIIFVNDQGSYVYDQSKVEGTQVVMLKDEERVARAFFSLLRDIGHCIALSYNGSADVYGRSTQYDFKTIGYDLPWLIQRSRQSWKPQTKTFKNKYLAGSGASMSWSQCISSIEQLPMVKFIDVQKMVCEDLEVNKKMNVSSLSLKSVAEAYGLKINKDEISFREQREILLTRNGDITDLLAYGIKDVIVLRELQEKLQGVNNALILQEQWQVSMTHALFKTQAFNLQTMLTKTYRDQGFIVRYAVSYEDAYSKIKGAFTSCMSGFFDSVCQLDFSSHYPSVMYQWSLSPENLSEDGPIVVDLHDETTPITYRWNQAHGILDSKINEIYHQRLQYKDLMTAAKKQGDSVTVAKYDRLQYACKIAINSAFGLACYNRSTLFSIAVGQSITGMGRQVIQATVQIAEARGLKVVAVDTDAVNVVLTEDIKNHDDLQGLIAYFNDAVRERFVRADGEHIMKLMTEEVVCRFYSISRKSYLWLDLQGAEMKQWVHHSQLSSEEHISLLKRSNLKTRGVVFRGCTKQGSDLLKSIIIDFMYSSPERLDNYFTELVDCHRHKLIQAIKEGDKDTVMTYADHIKCTQGNQTVRALRLKYPELVDAQFLDVVLTHSRISKKAMDVAIPVSKINDLTVVDVDAQLRKFFGRFLKVIKSQLEEQDQLKAVRKTAFKMHLEQMQDEREDGDVVLRVEKGSRGKRTHDLALLNAEQYVFVARAQPKLSFHEVISNDTVRFVMDVDGCQFVDTIDRIVMNAQEVLMRYCPDQQVLVYYLKNDTKNAYHVYSNVSCSIHMCKLIASEVAFMTSEKGVIDLAIYRQGGSLRLFNCPKIGLDGCVSERSIYRLPSRADPLRYMMTSTVDTLSIITPMHLSQGLGIDVSYVDAQEVEVFTEEAKKKVESWMTQHKIEGQLMVNALGLRINTKKHHCPQHNKKHDREGYQCFVKGGFVFIRCFAAPNVAVHKLSLSAPVEEKNIADIIAKMTADMSDLERVSSQHQKYFSLTVPEVLPSTVFIKSALGTGKTHQVIEFRDRIVGNAVIMSHRVTFTNDQLRRYGSRARSYQDIKGVIDFEDYDTCIVQVDSLQRVSKHMIIDLLIVDEVESLLSQLTGGVCRKTNAHESFLRMIKTSKHVIVMDGFLQEETRALIQMIRGEEGFSYQNTFKPYEGMVSEIVIANKKNDQLQIVIDDLKQKVLTERKRVVVNVLSRRLALTVEDWCKRYDLKTVCIHGDDAREVDDETHYAYKQRILKDVTESFVGIDVFIYTGTLTAGADIQEPFDHLIAVYMNMSTDPMQFVQGLYRVRNFKSMKVVLPDFAIGHPLAIHQTLPQEYQSLLIKSPHEQLQHYCHQRLENMRAMALSIIPKQLLQMGHVLDVIGQVQDSPKIEELKAFTQQMKEERKEALTQGCIDDDALKAYKEWTMYRVESREYAHLFERIQTYHHIGINDETIIKIDSNDELRSYILKNDRAYAIWLTQQKLQDVEFRVREDVMLRKQDVKDTKINLQKITKARDIQRVAMVLPDIEGLFTLEDDRLSKAAVASKGKRMITAITEGYASRGFVIKSHKRERKGEKRVQMYSL